MLVSDSVVDKMYDIKEKVDNEGLKPDCPNYWKRIEELSDSATADVLFRFEVCKDIVYYKSTGLQSSAIIEHLKNYYKGLYNDNLVDEQLRIHEIFNWAIEGF